MRSSNWLPSENEDIQLKTSRQVMKCDSFWCARRVSAHDDKRLWKAVDFRQGTIIPRGSESKKCSLTKNDIPARIALREEARWQGKGGSTPREVDRELIDNLRRRRTADGRQGFYPSAVKGPWTCSGSADPADETVVRAAQDSATLSLTCCCS